MITLHRLGQPTKQLHINHDMIVTVEANPDTVITLETGAKIVVAERPEQIVRDLLDCRAEILARAMRLRDAEQPARFTPSSPSVAPRLQAVAPPDAAILHRAAGQ
jgi:uncharacterized protein YlzI (FlbEa/FlbD family)